jgi:hypothetical protein
MGEHGSEPEGGRVAHVGAQDLVRSGDSPGVWGGALACKKRERQAVSGSRPMGGALVESLQGCDRLLRASLGAEQRDPKLEGLCGLRRKLEGALDVGAGRAVALCPQLLPREREHPSHRIGCGAAGQAQPRKNQKESARKNRSTSHEDPRAIIAEGPGRGARTRRSGDRKRPEERPTG